MDCNMPGSIHAVSKSQAALSLMNRSIQCSSGTVKRQSVISSCPIFKRGSTLENEFPRCRWFSRGWTLQELLAPPIVLFYDRVWEETGSKIQLCHIISNITSIPKNAIVGDSPLSYYSIAQKMSWAASRITSQIEDMAYYLLGILSSSHIRYLYSLALWRKTLRVFQVVRGDIEKYTWHDATRLGTQARRYRRQFLKFFRSISGVVRAW